MPICVDCISTCEGLVVSGTLASGEQFSSPLTIVDNPNSPIGYDYTFPIPTSETDYIISFDGIDWLILNEFGNVVAVSSNTGSNNNLCPPTAGWTSPFGTFQSLFVDQLVVPTPSVDCVTTNGTFNTDATGWTVTNGTWAVDFGGSVKYSTALLGSLTQNSILSIGETYSITVSYYAPGLVSYCSPSQILAGFIKISAGTNFYSEQLRDTVGEPGQVITITTQLTCEGNENLKIEVQDPNECFSTDNGNRGIFIDNVCAVRLTNVTDPTGPSPLPSVLYLDVLEVPVQVNGVDWNTKLLQYQECLAKKGTTFYNKVVGGVKCDYRELSKLKLINELLAQKNEDKALDCIYTGESIPTAVYKDPPVLSLSGGTECNGNFTITLTQDGVVNGKPAFKGEVPPGEFGPCDQEIGIYYDSGQSRWEATLNGTFYNDYLESTGDYPVGGPWQGTVLSITLTQCINDCEPPSKPPATSYLETFINFANKFCADCIITGSAPTPTTPTSPSLEIQQTPLTSETGVQITTQFNQQITI